MRRKYSMREISVCGYFGASAMLLPVFFHLVQLGSVFMPMYIPLLALPFFVSPMPAVITALIVPVLSGLLTGMPPFFPPVAFMMSIELGLSAGIIGLVLHFKKDTSPFWILLPVLITGRFLYTGMVWGFSKVMVLPAGFLSGVSFFSGWPGVILMLVTIPALVSFSHKIVGNRNTLDGK
ncbi:MAG: ECF transporter S component [Deltaproteobacteria bacterium]|nr:ECF transporter S component [Deltaproteobacteria bacterium]